MSGDTHDQHNQFGTSTPLKKIDDTDTSTSQSRTNPFDSHSNIESFCTSILSPGLFNTKKTPTSNKSTPGSFQWGIEHLGLLKPVEFEENNIEQIENSPDPETKAKLEEALEYYYANVHYVPSPDVNPSLIGQPKNLSASCSSISSATKTPYSTKRFLPPPGVQKFLQRFGTPQFDNISPINAAAAHIKPNGLKRVEFLVEKKSKETQTAITIPPDFDLSSVLGEDFLYVENESNMKEDDANLSFNTRRKLFADEDHEEENLFLCRTPPKNMEFNINMNLREEEEILVEFETNHEFSTFEIKADLDHENFGTQEMPTLNLSPIHEPYTEEI
uniref:Protein aurora borealis n=1 Tax=Acrobeloides nanus TaxID=290746 RepID=A0A914DAS7_9BILA